MNLSDAIYAAVHDYPGGAESLGPRMPMSPVVLRSKVNPNTEHHHVTVRDLDKVMMLTGDFRPMYALAANHHHACVPLELGPIGDLAILDRITEVWKKIGDVGQSTQRTLADGRVDAAEVAAFSDDVDAAIRSLLALKSALEALKQ